MTLVEHLMEIKVPAIFIVIAISIMILSVFVISADISQNWLYWMGAFVFVCSVGSIPYFEGFETTEK